jgi:hypothetical protein
MVTKKIMSIKNLKNIKKNNNTPKMEEMSTNR